jgi:hypothetical protein
MLRLLEVLGGVLVGRGVTTADVLAREADAEMNPAAPYREALRAAGRRSMDVARHLRRDVRTSVRQIDLLNRVHRVLAGDDTGNPPIVTR